MKSSLFCNFPHLRWIGQKLIRCLRTCFLLLLCPYLVGQKRIYSSISSRRSLLRLQDIENNEWKFGSETIVSPSTTEPVRHRIPGISSAPTIGRRQLWNIFFVTSPTCSADTMTDRDSDTENQTIAIECFLFSVVSGTLDSLYDNCPNGINNETLLSMFSESLWTLEQRQLLMELDTVPRQVFISLGVFLVLVVLFGIIANSTVFYIFSRYCIKDSNYVYDIV